MAPPSPLELYGSFEPQPAHTLVPDADIRPALTGPGSPFATEKKLIHGRLQTVYSDLPPSNRAFWMTAAQVRIMVGRGGAACVGCMMVIDPS